MDGQETSQLPNGLVIAASAIQNVRYIIASLPEWSQFTGAAGPIERLFQTALAHEPSGEPQLCGCIIRFELKRQPVFRFRLALVPLLLIRIRQQDMRVGKIRVELQRLPGGTEDLGAHLTG